jgi:hypothetical protein
MQEVAHRMSTEPNTLYRKPFDMIFQRVKNQEWSALQDDFRTLLSRSEDFEPVFSCG